MDMRVGERMPPARKNIPVKFDGGRSGRRYMGHPVKDDGTVDTTTLVQFILSENDPGVDKLIPDNVVIECERCPDRLASLSCWSSSITTKLRAVSIAPYAMLW